MPRGSAGPAAVGPAAAPLLARSRGCAGTRRRSPAPGTGPPAAAAHAGGGACCYLLRETRRLGRALGGGGRGARRGRPGAAGAERSGAARGARAAAGEWRGQSGTGQGGRAVTGRARGSGGARTPARRSGPVGSGVAGRPRGELLGSGFADANPPALGSNGVTLTGRRAA